jgi:acetyltransferase
MLTDVLSDGGFEVPAISGPPAKELLARLHPGSSVANPIDVLATGGVEQLEAAIDCVDNELEYIDGMCVIFGSPGLYSMEPVYNLIDEKMRSCKKPIYPILPSTINASAEISTFLAKGRINFPDEVLFGQALVKSGISVAMPAQLPEPSGNVAELRKLADSMPDGYLLPHQVQKLLDSAGINRIGERVVTSEEEAVSSALSLGFPVVMKVVGPVHKTDVGGVLLNLANHEDVVKAFRRLMSSTVPLPC